MLLVLLLACASAEHLVCNYGASFTSYPMKECINAVDGSFKYEKEDYKTYKLKVFALRDCDGYSLEDYFSLDGCCEHHGGGVLGCV